MPVEVNRDSVFVDMRLTSIGRQLASLGRLRFNKAVLLDYEVDYRVENSETDIGDNFVLSPTDTAQNIPPVNFDGSPAIPLGPKNVVHGKENDEVEFYDFEFFTSADTRFFINTPRCFALANALTSNLVGTNVFQIENIYRNWPDLGNAAGDECVGQLMMVRFAAPEAGLAPFASYELLDDLPYASLWYRIQSYNGSAFILDRPLPNFNTGTAGDYASGFIYSWSGISDFYASATTADTQVWNMQIIRTINEIGSTGATSAYTTYGSVSYNGVKHMLGFNTDQRAIGIIHDGNPNLDMDGIERLEISATTLYLPTLLWHRKPEFMPGGASKGGHVFTDRKSQMHYDPIARLYYSKLRDGTDSASIEVGRVYHDLRSIVITHPELLTAMSYKSNRNWTLPPLRLSLEANYFPGSTGLCQNNYTYLVTYTMAANQTYASASTFSYRDWLHCGHISRIDGMEGGPHLLMAHMESNHFPYMRSTGKVGSSVYSGTGWNANSMNILIKEIPTVDFSGLSHVSHTGWKKLNGGGAYSLPAGETTISASGLSSYQFVITRDDYLAATDYDIGVLTGHEYERSMSGLSYGDETFFYGNIEYDLVKDPERISLKFALMPDRFNSTKNYTFGEKNESTYITAVYIMDDLDRVVAVAKPSRPIKKNYNRYVEFKLDLIY